MNIIQTKCSYCGNTFEYTLIKKQRLYCSSYCQKRNCRERVLNDPEKLAADREVRKRATQRWKENNPDFQPARDYVKEYQAKKARGISSRKLSPRVKEARAKLRQAARGNYVRNRYRFVNGRCEVCKSIFTAKWMCGKEDNLNLESIPKVCSRTCLNKKRKWTQFGKISRTVRFAVYDRDNGICQICDLPVNMNAQCPNPWAPTLDHIKPQSLGGTHDMDNLQLAHFSCNYQKSDALEWEVIRDGNAQRNQPESKRVLEPASFRLRNHWRESSCAGVYC